MRTPGDDHADDAGASPLVGAVLEVLEGGRTAAGELEHGGQDRAAQVSDPTPGELAAEFALRFRGHANSFAMAYGGPLYLVGSMLTSLEPGDVDLRLQLGREDLELWFGKDFDSHGIDWAPGRWRLEREQLKQSRRLSRMWRGYPCRRFDFQFQSTLFSEFDGLPIMREGPFLRLDTVPLHYFAAGRGDP